MSQPAEDPLEAGEAEAGAPGAEEATPPEATGPAKPASSGGNAAAPQPPLIIGPPIDPEDVVGVPGRRGGIAGVVKRGLVSMAAATYDARADDLQDRAVAAMRQALREESSRIIEVATHMYDGRADDLEERAVRAIRKVLEDETERFLNVAQSTYDARADDLEDRAVRALRRAMVEETRRIRSTIERSVQAKRREVRLSLLVLVLANLLYLLVYWLTTGFE